MSAPVTSQIAESELMDEMRWASNALAAFFFFFLKKKGETENVSVLLFSKGTGDITPRMNRPI
jgi:hypothetical protein